MTVPVKKGALYFAHPVNSYDTPLETAVEKLITELLPGYSIESPNQPHHQEAYEKWQTETAENRDVHSAMQYFFKVVQPTCVGSVALPFLDGKMGLGVAGEVVRDADDGKPTWFINPRFTLHNKDRLQKDLSFFIKKPSGFFFKVRSFTDFELVKIRHEVAEHQARIGTGEEYEDASLVLSHQETRLRTFYVYRGEQRPYAEAHLVSMPIPKGFYPEEHS